ncbi:MAG: HAD-IIA family hydrolase [Candidatus Lokiarchaeota archaeon]
MTIKDNFKIDLDVTKGFLIDINGTLYFKEKEIENAIETIDYLKELGLKLLFLTNTDSKSLKTIHKILNSFGFNIKQNEIFTPIIALKNYLKTVVTNEVKKEFIEFNLKDSSSNENPDYVILADFRDDWDVNHLNIAFRFLQNGAELLGSQGNVYFLDKKGQPTLDTGSFINMLSQAANIRPKIFGKPSKDYFLSALDVLGFKQGEVYLIGDDFHSDILGAQKAKIKGILVKTGKGQYYNEKS